MFLMFYGPFAYADSFRIDVWADNWFAAYLNGSHLLEDSVSIRTERSFNAESHRFSSELPMVLAFEIKDFKENDTGLEYIGSRRQQMGDGGFITQITDLGSGDVIGVSDSGMRCLVVHKAPLQRSCVDQRHPVAGQGVCGFSVTPVPVQWQAPGFDDSNWPLATEYSERQVRPKGGYDQVSWSPAAKLIWTDDLEKDNTLLCRLTITGKRNAKRSRSKQSNADIASAFSSFPKLSTRTDGQYLLVSSDGMPDHGMMTGITSWQQQVPVPQNYTGNNAWRIPLNPVLADRPMSLKEHFHRGAVAIAVNGVPIFNPLNNRGEYAAHAGELDQWGGHSGRADDYHYHLAPVHLEAVVGKGKPIAYVLDGFALYGKTDHELDEYLGRFNEHGVYQYHAVDHPPYFMASMRGVVRTDSSARAPEDQIEPQPRSQPVRNRHYGPLRGAEITAFSKTGKNAYSLQYRINNEIREVNYRWTDNGQYRFEYVDGSGRATTENYTSQTGNPPRAGSPRSEKRPPRDKRPPGNKGKKRRYCGDGICDHTESRRQCPVDCR